MPSPLEVAGRRRRGSETGASKVAGQAQVRQSAQIDRALRGDLRCRRSLCETSTAPSIAIANNPLRTIDLILHLFARRCSSVSHVRAVPPPFAQWKSGFRVVTTGHVAKRAGRDCWPAASC